MAIEFSLSAPVAYAIGSALAIPGYLSLIVRLPRLRGRNALQFAMAVTTMLIVWVALVASGSSIASLTRADLWTSLMIMTSGTLAYLEIWGLMSRGYTLGIMLTLYAASKPLDERALAQRYRGGQGLSWVMHHRLGGLIAAHAVRREGELIQLTFFPGLFIARVYQMLILVLGLRRTG